MGPSRPSSTNKSALSDTTSTRLALGDTQLVYKNMQFSGDAAERATYLHLIGAKDVDVSKFNHDSFTYDRRMGDGTSEKTKVYISETPTADGETHFTFSLRSADDGYMTSGTAKDVLSGGEHKEFSRDFRDAFNKWLSSRAESNTASRRGSSFMGKAPKTRCAPAASITSSEAADDIETGGENGELRAAFDNWLSSRASSGLGHSSMGRASDDGTTPSIISVM
ncbi:uncharacterized protein I303_104347 [Kwoniella dejecticola CBS 10117]|uniref:Uncharacterized protein n=1 Tax=Kwoniella dejecticola CBS 10117 TaxID=1296121 RepID=A0A1A6A5L6_9TREE|nr:uncharacterized protein I303_04678 [Kwoniella dejecticola CBS 10117]OBR85343.1 hypothetical protein I303_04678 [Kwoniella dejecticola CBS 10117]